MKRFATLCLMVLAFGAALPGCAPTAEFYNSEGLNAFAAHDYSRARAAFNEAVLLRPDVSSYQYNLGAAYQANGELDKAAFGRDLMAEVFAFVPECMSNVEDMVKEAKGR